MRISKTLLGSVVLATAWVGNVQAQVIGVSIGRTSSGVDWVPPGGSGFSASSNTNRRSVSIAAAIGFGVHSWLSAETGLRLVPKGFEVTGPTFHMRYLEMPLLAVWRPTSGAGPFLETGIVAGWRVECRRFFPSVFGFHEDDCGPSRIGSRDLAPLRSWDISWDVGLGARLPVGAGWLVGRIRYQRSLFDIQPSGFDRMLNRVATFSIGYARRIGTGA